MAVFACAAVPASRSLPPDAHAREPGPLRQTLHAVAALPPALAGRFTEMLAFQQATSGRYFVFDRRGHTVYAIDPDMREATRLLAIGQEEGRVLLPFAFDAGPGELFAVGDAPGGGRDRVQVFDPGGYRVGGFTLPSRTESRVQLGGLVLNGLATLQFTRDYTVLVNQPESGALITEYDVQGRLLRTIGTLRPTGHEPDRDLHLAFNSGLPLRAPSGGFLFVFQSGEPRFQRYSDEGRLLFERAIQGHELDAVRRAQPTRWPQRTGAAGRDVPIVTPVVRAAAVSPRDDLWIALSLGVTYVYDAQGEKSRIVRFRGAGPLQPTSLYFTEDGRLLATPGGYVFRPDAPEAQ